MEMVQLSWSIRSPIHRFYTFEIKTFETVGGYSKFQKYRRKWRVIVISLTELKLRFGYNNTNIPFTRGKLIILAIFKAILVRFWFQKFPKRTIVIGDQSFRNFRTHIHFDRFQKFPKPFSFTISFRNFWNHFQSTTGFGNVQNLPNQKFSKPFSLLRSKTILILAESEKEPFILNICRILWSTKWLRSEIRARWIQWKFEHLNTACKCCCCCSSGDITPRPSTPKDLPQCVTRNSPHQNGISLRTERQLT